MALDDKSQFTLSWKRVGMVVGVAALAILGVGLLSGSEGLGGLATLVAGVAQLSVLAAIVVGVIWVIRRGTAQGIRDAQQKPALPPVSPSSRFKVTGADEQTGDDTAYFVNAATAEEAAMQARERGTLVAEIRKV